MVRTNSESRFVLLSLDNIRNSAAIILQIEDTETKFEGGAKCYLCEVIDRCYYDKAATNDALTAEVLKLNAEIRSLRKKNEQLKLIIEKLEAAK